MTNQIIVMKMPSDFPEGLRPGMSGFNVTVTTPDGEHFEDGEILLVEDEKLFTTRTRLGSIESLRLHGPVQIAAWENEGGK